MLRTRLSLAGGAAAVEPLKLLCVKNLEAAAGRDGAVTTSPDGSYLTAPSSSGCVVSLDGILYYRLEAQRTHDGIRRDYRVDLALDERGQLDVSLWLTQLRAAPKPSLRAPIILRDILAEHRVTDAGTPIGASPEPIQTSEAFAGAIFDLDRNLPLLVLSQPVPLAPDEVDDMARRLQGVVRVMVLEDVDVSWGVTHMYGQPWSTFNGAIRVYAPGLLATDQTGTRAGRLFLGPDVLANLHDDRHGALDAIAAAALAPSLLRFADEPMPSLDAALAERRRARRDGLSAVVQPEPASNVVDAPPSDVTVATDDPPAPAKPDWELLAQQRLRDIAELEQELQSVRAEMESLQRTNSLLRSERDEYEQLGSEAEVRAKNLEAQLRARPEQPSPPFAGLTDAWATWIGEAVGMARQASQVATELAALRDEAATSRAKADALEAALAQKAAAGTGAVPVPPNLGNLSAFETYLTLRYPGVFALTPGARRSFKGVIYDDEQRFYRVVDLLGTTYVTEQRAGGVLTQFEHEAHQLRLKSTPSCTPDTIAGEYGPYHRVPVSDGSYVQMHELRDGGTTFDRRHFLYFGFAYDAASEKVILNTFEHPPTPSDRT